MTEPLDEVGTRVLVRGEPGRIAGPTYTPEHAAMALASSYDHPIIVDRWRLPLGAFGDSQGPT
mgnify:CR=1 FL=1